MNFRMELNSPDAARLVFDRRQGVAALSYDFKTAWQFARFISMRHPDVERRWKAGKQARFLFYRNLGAPVFALGAGNDLAAELVRNEMQAVADAKHRQAEAKHTLVSGRSVMIVDGRRPTAQDDARRTVTFDFIQGGCARKDSG